MLWLPCSPGGVPLYKTGSRRFLMAPNSFRAAEELFDDSAMLQDAELEPQVPSGSPGV